MCLWFSILFDLYVYEPHFCHLFLLGHIFGKSENDNKNKTAIRFAHRNTNIPPTHTHTHTLLVSRYVDKIEWKYYDTQGKWSVFSGGKPRHRATKNIVPAPGGWFPVYAKLCAECRFANALTFFHPPFFFKWK